MMNDRENAIRGAAGLSRRHLLAGAAALPLLPLATLGATMEIPSFPENFIWGISTSAAQIEGAALEDGRGPSIWDEFAARPGTIKDGSTPAIACDHYHRWQEDVALLRDLGVTAYRFSIAWPRVLPEGTGTVNPKGLDFYARLVDALLAAGITPMPCLYHWDLPLALGRKGGWLNRDIAAWFTEYALLMTRHLGDRTADWFMLNEPSVVGIFGYGKAEHAPGLGGGAAALFAALHHQNLAQGTALHALRAERPGLRLGTVLSLQPVVPESPRPDDRAAALRWDAAWNRIALDGLMRGAVPDLFAEAMADLVKPGDLDRIRFPVDMLGLNYYSRMTMREEKGALLDAGWGKSPATRYTAMGWPVEPPGLFEILSELRALYGNPAVFVTENGAAYEDHPDVASRVEDTERIAYIRDHLAELHRALAAGCNVKGYMVWSLLDNYEWAEGYGRRFGIVRIDYPTQTRTPKASYRWYREVIRSGRIG